MLHLGARILFLSFRRYTLVKSRPSRKSNLFEVCPLFFTLLSQCPSGVWIIPRPGNLQVWVGKDQSCGRLIKNRNCARRGSLRMILTSFWRTVLKAMKFEVFGSLECSAAIVASRLQESVRFSMVIPVQTWHKFSADQQKTHCKFHSHQGSVGHNKMAWHRKNQVLLSFMNQKVFLFCFIFSKAR